MTRAFRRLLLLGLLLGAAPAARADKATARQLTAEATRNYKLGHFQEALDAFSKAYEAFPAPLLLFNIGQCQRELGNDEQAVFFLRNYLHDAPNAKNRPLVEDLIAECERKIDAKRVETQRRQEEERQQRALALAESAQREPGVLPPPVLSGTLVDGEALRGEERAGEHKLIAGLTLAAAGAVAIGLGGYFGTRVSSDTTTLNKVAAAGSPWTSQNAATQRDGNRSAIVADTLYAAGGAVLIAGGVLALIGWRQSASARSSLSVAVLPTAHGSQAEVAWNF